MRRRLIVFLLVLMPLQLTWAAAARYCGHEAGGSPAARHFGHHEHSHVQALPSGDADNGGTSLTADDDCSVCHLGCGQLLQTAAAIPLDTGAPSLIAAPEPPLDSRVPPGPERPDRRIA